MPMYVIQVAGGREAHAKSLIERTMPELVSECFVPRREMLRRVGGEWVRLTERLFPGYLFVTTGDILGVSEALRRIPAFTRLLGKSDERIIPLSQDEVAWLTALMEPLEKVVELSVGVIEGDKVMIIDGPLKGHEALISKIDRHKRCACLDMRMFGRTKTIKVALEIVRKNA